MKKPQKKHFGFNWGFLYGSLFGIAQDLRLCYPFIYYFLRKTVIYKVSKRNTLFQFSALFHDVEGLLPGLGHGAEAFGAAAEVIAHVRGQGEGLLAAADAVGVEQSLQDFVERVVGRPAFPRVFHSVEHRLGEGRPVSAPDGLLALVEHHDGAVEFFPAFGQARLRPESAQGAEVVAEGVAAQVGLFPASVGFRAGRVFESGSLEEVVEQAVGVEAEDEFPVELHPFEEGA